MELMRTKNRELYAMVKENRRNSAELHWLVLFSAKVDRSHIAMMDSTGEL